MATINQDNLKSPGSPVNIASVTCGVQRKINIGNFESVDVYCSASIPVEIIDPKDKEEIEEKLLDAMEQLIHITSKETAEKYAIVKGMNNE